MKQFRKIQKRINKLKSRPILSLILGLSLLSIFLVVTMIGYASGANYFKSSSDATIQATKTPDNNGDLFGVVKKIDMDKKLITIFDINSLSDVVLYYTEGSRIFDKYGQDLSISKKLIGTIVDAGYHTDDSKLIQMQISKKAWEYKNVCNLNINKPEYFMRIADSKYKYTDDMLAFDKESIISVDDLAEQDMLTLWGYQETVWSVIVTKGHGTVKIDDYGNFVGGNITVGYEAMQQITKDMEITVREGNCNLTVDNGTNFTGTKNITVKRNKVTWVSLDNLGPEGVKMGKVNFDLTPFGADLFVDGILTSYANPVKLAYGSHKIAASLDGYTTYEQYINVNEAGKTVKIILPKAGSTNTESANNSKSSSSSNNTSASTNTSNNSDTANNDGTSNTSEASNTDNSSQTDNTSDTDSSNVSDNAEENNSSNTSIDKSQKIFIQNPIEASVYLDGKYMGTSPCGFKKYIGSHVLTFIRKGYTTKSYTVEVKNDGKDTYFSLPSLVKSSK